MSNTDHDAEEYQPKGVDRITTFIYYFFFWSGIVAWVAVIPGLIYLLIR